MTYPPPGGYPPQPDPYQQGGQQFQQQDPYASQQPYGAPQGQYPQQDPYLQDNPFAAGGQQQYGAADPFGAGQQPGYPQQPPYNPPPPGGGGSAMGGAGKSMWLRIIIAVVVVGLVAGGAFLFKFFSDDVSNAEAGDCITEDLDVNNMKIVGCDDPDAVWKVTAVDNSPSGTADPTGATITESQQGAIDETCGAGFLDSTDHDVIWEYEEGSNSLTKLVCIELLDGSGTDVTDGGQDGVTEQPSDGASDDGSTDDGSTDDGSTDDGSTDDELEQRLPTEGECVDDDPNYWYVVDCESDLAAEHVLRIVDFPDDPDPDDPEHGSAAQEVCAGLNWDAYYWDDTATDTAGWDPEADTINWIMCVEDV